MAVASVSEAKIADGSYAVEVCVGIAVFLCYLCILLLGGIMAAFLPKPPNFTISGDISLWTVWGSLLTYMLFVFIFSPIRLFVKEWYQGRTAANSFEAEKSKKSRNPIIRYFKAVYFCFIRGIASFVLFFTPFLPSLILFGVIKAVVSAATILSAEYTGILLLLACLLFLTGIAFGAYNCISLFYTDYVYTVTGRANPFYAILLSRKISFSSFGGLFCKMLAVIPYFLLCIFIVTIPFILPKIKRIFAVYAASRIELYIQGK